MGGLLLLCAQLVVAGTVLCLTIYPLFRGMGLTFYAGERLIDRGFSRLGMFLIMWSWLGFVVVPILLVLLGHLIESYFGSVLGQRNGADIFPTILAFSPWIVAWFIGIVPAIRDGWGILGDIAFGWKVALVLGSFLLIALVGLARS